MFISESSQHAQVTGTGIDLIGAQLRAQIKEDIRKRISELNKQWDDSSKSSKSNTDNITANSVKSKKQHLNDAKMNKMLTAQTIKKTYAT
jgi:hypothetical protein